MRVSLTTIIGASLIALAAASPALAKTEVSPYIEVAQVLTADLNGSGDVLTYSQIAAGIDASTFNNRSEFQVSYRYERRIGYDDRVEDTDVHSGLARGKFQIVPRTLTIEAGALAARARSDIRGSAPGVLVGNIDNVSQVYSVYAGPTLTTDVGPVNVGAAYRVGYSKVEASRFVPPAGQPRLDVFDDSIGHLATASVGMESGVLPFGWTVSGAYEREDASQLDQRFERKGVRGDVVVPVTPSLALVGGVGYEDIEASQRAALLTVAGDPVTDGNGRFVTDPNSPRLLSYDFDGVYWDAGVLWKPSRRTTLEARVGRRYDSWSYTGSLSHQVSSATSIQVGVYDEVLTFGQQLTDGLSRLPTNFTRSGNPLTQNFGGCTFGTGDAGAGGCLSDVLQAVNASVYRSRGVTGIISTARGPWTIGVGAGYARRSFAAPVVGAGFSVNGLSDQSYFAQGDLGYVIDDRSDVSASVFATRYDPGIANAPSVTSVGASSAYSRRFGRRLSATAAVGLFSNKTDGFEGDLSASALLGARYQF